MSRKLSCLVGVALTVAGMSPAYAQEVIGFNDLPSGHFAGTEGDPNTFEVFGSAGSGHTSCSQSLEVGDQFGSVILREFIPE